MSRPRPSGLALAALLGISACAAPGPYPSLAPRAIERELAAADEAPPSPALPDDPGLSERIRPLIEKAESGDAEFQAAIPAARAATGRAGSSGSDSWVEAQQAVSRAEAARALTTAALAEIDALALAEARSRALSPGDLERLREGVAQVQAIADRQQEAIRALEASLRGG